MSKGLLATVVLSLFTLAMGVASTAEAHGGGTNRCGCHVNRSTGACHCHHDGGCGCSCQPDRCEG